MTKPKGDRIRLLIVDDHKVVRLGLITMFSRHRGVQIVGDVGTMAAAVEDAQLLKPDVVLMDVRLPDGSGIDACREIRNLCPDTQVLFLTSFADDEAMFATVLAGAAGFLLKQADEDGVIRAVETVANGQSIVDPVVTHALLQQMRSFSAPTTNNPSGPLSPQEERVMALVVDGKTNKEIGIDMGLSEKTVKNYLSNIFQKMQVSRRSQAAVLFERQRIGR
ncbi:MAG: response regulator transcription factor [Nitrospirales bacterium]|nr:response regulator transcription factor [Nitrospirales bacterium]